MRRMFYAIFLQQFLLLQSALQAMRAKILQNP
jgi:hypothetical protein